MSTKNTGAKLWRVQRAQGTGLCMGLDPHYQPEGQLDAAFYGSYHAIGGTTCDKQIFRELGRSLWPNLDENRLDGTANFLTGVTNYYLRLVRTAWDCGIRVFKPQSAFYERFAPFGQIILFLICEEIHNLSRKSGESCFIILDAKRGDIDSTQEPYYAAYLQSDFDNVVAGIGNQYCFDAMTVTTWMGEDVLTPGLPYLRDGNALIVVTRTSNPSGTTLQDAGIMSSTVDLGPKQERFRLGPEICSYVAGLIGRAPTVHEIMLFMTSRFCRDNKLDTDGVSPVMSVMGATEKMSQSFRLIRGNGAIALVPGWGHQEGNFENIEPLLVREGPLAGHWGILASSRAMNYPWTKKYGGSGDPKNLEVDLRQAVAAFRVKEQVAYARAGANYPF